MPKLIGTHSGSFHCDEALAVAMLRQTSAFSGSDLVRTRDPAKLEQCDIVVDVGGIYDPASHRYDHHQRGFTEVFVPGHAKFGRTKLSSAGLVYKHFGKEVIARAIGLDEESVKVVADEERAVALGKKADEEAAINLNESDRAKVELLYKKVYEEFIEALDAIDNGIPQYPADLEPAYRSGTGLAARVGALNPRWNEPEHDLDERFEKAVALTGAELASNIDYLSKAWMPARDIVADAFNRRITDVDPSGRIIILERPCPWKDHLYTLEEEAGLTDPHSKVAYILYPESVDKPDCNWRVQCVPVRVASFESRKPLPEAWRGIRDEELSELTRIPGGVFVHASGFIGGNKTREGVLEMARKSLEI
ncbi:metal-dependent protein hydrolase [Ramicandelaber brevisporus]|nr:metal-dependent protein hydrolase [Ramicandelaber brevisporus]